ncbi:hypothetical protein J7481_19525 [Labrenzia sp. R4_2]|uniref:hypothetical protein n=1 Tax=Labrenzia sp. R4_2 TaxID=2821107 RepID=UPI001ADABF25|nr:hypothetical protein [Labrenzia sp. R4_2]MBO9421707.1 hypothetical protein [Labrenzia sp. R4_2]
MSKSVETTEPETKTGVIAKLKAYRAANEGDETFVLPETGVTVTFPKFRKHGVWASCTRLAKNNLGKAQVLYICRVAKFDGETITASDFGAYIPLTDANELMTEVFVAGEDDDGEDSEGKA